MQDFELKKAFDVIREDLFPSCWPTLRTNGWKLLHKTEAGHLWFWAENEKTGRRTSDLRPIGASAVWDILSLNFDLEKNYGQKSD